MKELTEKDKDLDSPVKPGNDKKKKAFETLKRQDTDPVAIVMFNRFAYSIR